MWNFVLAIAGSMMTAGIVRQIYTAATAGCIMTGRSMNRRVFRDKEPQLFRNNLIANILALPLVAGGTVLFVAEALKRVGLLP